MQFLICLFTQKRESLYVVSEIQCMPLQASSMRNEPSYSIVFNLPKIKFTFLKFLVLHIYTIGDTRPATLASVKKPLSAPISLICNSPWHLDNNWTYIARPNISNCNVPFGILYQFSSASFARSRLVFLFWMMFYNS